MTCLLEGAAPGRSAKTMSVKEVGPHVAKSSVGGCVIPESQFTDKTT